MKLTPISFNLARVAIRGLGGGADEGVAEAAASAGTLWDEAAEGRKRGAGGGGEATTLSSLASNLFT